MTGGPEVAHMLEERGYGWVEEEFAEQNGEVRSIRGRVCLEPTKVCSSTLDSMCQKGVGDNMATQD